MQSAATSGTCCCDKMRMTLSMMIVSDRLDASGMRRQRLASMHATIHRRRCGPVRRGRRTGHLEQQEQRVVSTMPSTLIPSIMIEERQVDPNCVILERFQASECAFTHLTLISTARLARDEPGHDDAEKAADDSNRATRAVTAVSPMYNRTTIKKTGRSGSISACSFARDTRSKNRDLNTSSR